MVLNELQHVAIDTFKDIEGELHPLTEISMLYLKIITAYMYIKVNCPGKNNSVKV